MRVCSSQQMRASDEISIKELLIPGIVLMENAATGIINEIKKEIDKNRLPLKGNALILSGTGNNGGDGFAVARHLKRMEWHVSIIIIGDYKKISADAFTNLEIIEKLGITIKRNFIEGKSKLILDNGIDLIIDSILGTGFKGELRPDIKSIIDSANKSNAFIISVDIPTGLNPDTGFATNPCIKADKTVALGLAKIGQLINDGPFYCGELVVEGLTIPNEVYDKVGIKKYLTKRDFLKKHIKIRPDNTHKGSYGKVLAIAGSRGMAGAALLAAGASLRSGAGIVRLAVPKGILNIVSGKVPELITKGLFEDENGCITIESLDEILEESDSASSIMVGPGLGISDGIYEIISRLIKKCKTPLIIDADGLNAIAKKPSVLLEKNCEILITPHPGEMARLMGLNISDIQKDRIGHAERFAKTYKVIVVLKGYRTIIATPLGETWINPTGNPGMATAGSGDVLTGIIASLIAQGLDIHIAAICATYIHGASGDYAQDKLGQLGMTAADIIKFIPYILKDIVNIQRKPEISEKIIHKYMGGPEDVQSKSN